MGAFAMPMLIDVGTPGPADICGACNGAIVAGAAGAGVGARAPINRAPTTIPVTVLKKGVNQLGFFRLSR